MSYREIIKHKYFRYLQTAVLSILLLLLFLFTGWQILGTAGLLLAIILMGFFLFSLYNSSTPVILSNAAKLDYHNAPGLYDLTNSLGNRAGLKTLPKLYYIPSSIMNAATIGSRENAAIIITQGLLNQLNSQEIEGVLAHEVSHIKNNDLAVFSFAQIIRQMTSFMARFGWILLLLYFPFYTQGFQNSFQIVIFLLAVPFISLLLQLALLRSREFSADLEAAELTGNPYGLASALKKLQQAGRPWFSVFLPLPERSESSIFQTHPATEERIKRLLSLVKH
jgi:heat shock protein HtpX